MAESQSDTGSPSSLWMQYVSLPLGPLTLTYYINTRLILSYDGESSS
jgi:hypothetical protein